MPNSSRKLARNRLALFAFALIASSSAFALSTDREQELFIDGGKMTSDQRKNITILTGNVTIKQGTIKGDGDKGTFYQGDDNSVKRAVLVGKPAHLEQKLDNDGGMMRARAATIDYKADTSIVDMTGDVVVLQEGRGEFRGEHLIYNTDTGEMTSGEEKAGERVHLRMMPKPKDATPAAAKPAAPDKKNADPTPAAPDKKSD